MRPANELRLTFVPFDIELKHALAELGVGTER
jgi:hypothetical protein